MLPHSVNSQLCVSLHAEAAYGIPVAPQAILYAGSLRKKLIPFIHRKLGRVTA